MNTLKITGGRLKGRTISLSGGGEARYTSSKVRQAIFNAIGSVEGKDVLDLFAGSGSFSIEALSRKARSATCVEIDRERASMLEKNLATMALNKYCQVFNMDVRYAIPLLSDKGLFYDIIFMDPPYEKGYLTETMFCIEKRVIYKRDAMIIMEHSKREIPIITNLRTDRPGETKSRHYGDTVITIHTIG
ncbi:MAG TPA: 16S rRNA (guanine(966)-N(2))-methyltransferase RsmD [Syntrophorhabdaceae bacterium]|nr:16S rRNA (guanine(966)-N(2))-methyltransferase RsmD [Syntrophorhabdaceae bacterium]